MNIWHQSITPTQSVDNEWVAWFRRAFSPMLPDRQDSFPVVLCGSPDLVIAAALSQDSDADPRAALQRELDEIDMHCRDDAQTLVLNISLFEDEAQCRLIGYDNGLKYHPADLTKPVFDQQNLVSLATLGLPFVRGLAAVLDARSGGASASRGLAAEEIIHQVAQLDKPQQPSPAVEDLQSQMSTLFVRLSEREMAILELTDRLDENAVRLKRLGRRNLLLRKKQTATGQSQGEGIKPRHVNTGDRVKRLKTGRKASANKTFTDKAKAKLIILFSRDSWRIQRLKRNFRALFRI